MSSISNSSAEFDEYAENYSAGMEHPLKRLVGATFANFIRNKVSQLDDVIALSQREPDRCSLLDFGSGCGEMLAELRRRGFAGSLAGCDQSEGMLSEARKRWVLGAPPIFQSVTEDVLPYQSNSFDMAIASAVFHHIERDARANWLSELRRVLRPGGHLYIFEHNPWNPITNFVVRTTPIDRNAELLSPTLCAKIVSEAGFNSIDVRHFLFFPPRFPVLDRAERCIAWLPAGGQYLLIARNA